MISSAVKTKSIEVKDKVKDYIGHTTSTESTHPTPRLINQSDLSFFYSLCFFVIIRHVSKQDKVTKLYRQTNQASVFSLDGDDEDDGKKNISKLNFLFL
jgi:hypothetical protein